VADAEPVRRWRSLLATATESIGDAQHARWICEEASGLTGAELTANLDDEATARAARYVDLMVERRLAGEPIQYVIGSWPFRHIDLAIDRRVLIPRPETEMVAGVAIELARAVGPERVVVDLGTGSGAIGLSCAFELPIDGTSVWLTDASSDALDVATANLVGIGRAARNVRVALGEWFDALPPEVIADVVVANPPYVSVGSPAIEPSVVEWEPTIALFGGVDGLECHRTIVRHAPGRLRPGGWLVLEIGADQGQAVARLLADAGFGEVAVRRDHAGLDRIVVGRRGDVSGR
jgi:release factor glutamine methyltransferase